jgi:hypothetical protein
MRDRFAEAVDLPFEWEFELLKVWQDSLVLGARECGDQMVSIWRAVFGW